MMSNFTNLYDNFTGNNVKRKACLKFVKNVAIDAHMYQKNIHSINKKISSCLLCLVVPILGLAEADLAISNR
jgi:hypothetical protein